MFNLSGIFFFPISVLNIMEWSILGQIFTVYTSNTYTHAIVSRHSYSVTFWVTLIILICVLEIPGTMCNACSSCKKVLSTNSELSTLKVFPPQFSVFSFYPEMHRLGCEVCLRGESWGGDAFGIYGNQKLTPSQWTSIFLVFCEIETKSMSLIQYL